MFVKLLWYNVCETETGIMFVKQRLWYNVCETETGIIFLECETETVV
jgi:hypothetical protein